MNVDQILNAIDDQISKLQRARAIVAGVEEPTPAKRRPGRPRKVAALPSKPAPKRTLSAEGRARIAAAQKKRWAATR